MSARRRHVASDRRLFAIGAVGIAVLLAIVVISYRANSGLPLQRSYRITVELPNAERLVVNNDVRIAGIRAGRIASVSAVRGGRSPSGRLVLALREDVRPLRSDTEVRVRPASILGTNYLDLIPGRRGRPLADGAALGLRSASSTVELTDLLDVFDRSTARSLQGALRDLGPGLAGRGPVLNETISALPATLADIGGISRILADSRTRLRPFLDAFATTAAALEPVAERLGGAVDGAAATLATLAAHRDALAATIDALPAAERSTTLALRRLRPALDDLARLSDDLTPAVGLLPRAIPVVNRTLDAGVRPLRDLRPFSGVLDATLEELSRFSEQPTTRASLQHAADLAVAAGGTLDTLLPAQLQCNVIGTWATNFASTFGTLGTGNGPAVANIGVTHLGAENELLQNAAPSRDAGINLLPNESRRECESGNEPYDGRQVLGNPKGDQPAFTRETHQQPAVRRLAASAGLLDRGRDAP